MGHLGLSPRSALNGARGQSSPMISARMMPDRKSKVDCSTCRTADPARNPCPPTAHAQQYEHVKARGCKFFFPFPPKEPEAAWYATGIRDARSGISIGMLLLTVMCTYGFCSLIIPPHSTSISIDRHRTRLNTTHLQKQHHAFCLPRH